MLVFIVISLAYCLAKQKASAVLLAISSQDFRASNIFFVSNQTLPIVVNSNLTQQYSPTTLQARPFLSASLRPLDSFNHSFSDQNGTTLMQGMAANRVKPKSHQSETEADSYYEHNAATAKGHEPFSVQIEDDRFYGGLVTYSHSRHPARICRLMNACVRNDGTLVLPRWLKQHDNTLSFHCGHSKLEFSLPDTKPPPPLQPYDRIGLTCPRPSMPHFLRDFMPNAVIFDLVYSDRRVSKSCHSRKGRECNPFPRLVQDFRPSILLHPRLKVLHEKKSWVRQFIKMMKPPKSGRQARVQYQVTSTSKTEDKQCYRSVLFTRGPYNKNIILRDHLREIYFLQSNNISKHERPVMHTYNSNRKKKERCYLNITVSNRQLPDVSRNRLIGRYITNIPDLRKAISRQAKRIPGLEINIATMTLEGKTLQWQINAMQKTDIWVAGLGPLLTNMIFLRENSTVVELQPFSNYPREYEDMARHLAHVNYERYIAHPDVEAFNACIHQLYPKGHAAHHKAMDILAKYTMAARKYAQADSTHSYVINYVNDTALRNVKMCAQMQRLDTNAKNLAIAVVRHARLRCGLPKPQLQSSKVL